jgi:hypothetical protein
VTQLCRETGAVVSVLAADVDGRHRAKPVGSAALDLCRNLKEQILAREIAVEATVASACAANAGGATTLRLKGWASATASCLPHSA